jgi:hypothetical protein
VIVKMIVEKQMECRLAGETEVLGENLPQRHFSPPQNSTWRDSGLNPGRRGGKPATNRLNYGAALERGNLSAVIKLAHCKKLNRVDVSLPPEDGNGQSFLNVVFNNF